MNAPPASPSSRWASLGAWTVIGITLLLVFAPVIGKEAPREAGRWLCAAALEQQPLDAQAALALVDRAIAVGGAQPDFLLLRATLHVDLKNASAAEADLDAALEAADDLEKVAVYAQRAEQHQRLHRWQAAVDDWKAIAKLVETIPGAVTRAELLNNLAYMRALANVELEQALVDVNLAITQVKQENSQFLDTRGYVLYRLGQYSRALADLDRAVQLMREERARILKVLDENTKVYIDQRVPRKAKKSLDRSLAVLLYHRSLAQDLFDEAKGAADLAEVRSLGLEPGDDLY